MNPTMTGRFSRLLLALASLALCLVSTTLTAQTAKTVTIDAAVSRGDWVPQHLYGVSSSAGPSNAAETQWHGRQIGRSHNVRVWWKPIADKWTGGADSTEYEALVLSHKGDGTGEYYGPAGTWFYDYLAGTVTERQLIDELKSSISISKSANPKVRIVESALEPQAHYNSFPEYLPPGVTARFAKYALYKVGYKAVNELNAENNYDIPLLYGGPNEYSTSTSLIRDFMADYVADTDPNKRIDFLSWHLFRNTPTQVNGWLATTQSYATTTGFPLASTPVYLTAGARYSTGDTSILRNPDTFMTNAAAWMSYNYYNISNGWQLWPFVYRDNGGENMHTIFQKATPQTYAATGNAMKAMSRFGRDRLASTNSVDANGIGAYSLASFDGNSLSVLAWTYSNEIHTNSYNVTVNVNNLPAIFAGKNLRVRRYLIDNTHSNHKYSSTNWALEQVADSTASHSGNYSATFGFTANAIMLLVLTPEGHGTLDFSDDFADGNDNGWTRALDTANWSVSGGSYLHSGTAEGLSVRGLAFADGAVQARVKAGTGSGAVLARYKDANNYYQLSLTDATTGKVQLYKKVGGTSTLIAEQAYALTSGTFYTLRLEFEGARLAASINGSPILSHWLFDYDLTGGQAGLRGATNTVEFDDVTFTKFNNVSDFVDDFADNNDLGWERLVGRANWSLASGALSLSGTAEGMTLAGRTMKDFSINALVKPTASATTASVLGRVQNNNNYYELRLSDAATDKVQFYRKSAGTFTLLQEQTLAITTNTAYDLGIGFSGSSILCTVNGSPVFGGAFTDATLASGRIGLRANGGSATFDDVDQAETFINSAGLWRFDENTGTTAADSSGNSNTGTITGATWTTGFSGSALNFNGTSGQFVTVADSNSLDFTSAIYLDCRVNFNAGAGTTEQRILNKDKGTGGPANSPYVVRVGSNGKIGLYWNGAWYESNVLTWSNATWYRIEVQYDGANVTFRRNGTAAGSVALASSVTPTSNGVLYLGRGPTVGWFNGKIDELRLATAP